MKHRKGFIKYCLKYGYNIFPVYSFGEERLFYTFNKGQKFRMWLNEFNIPTILAISSKYWWCLPILPNSDVELTSCVGRPIQFPKIDDPKKEDVDEWHQKYIERENSASNTIKM